MKYIAINRLILFSVVNYALYGYSASSVIHPGCDAGFFAHFCSILDLLDQFEHKQIARLKIDFGTSGFYYEQALGSNWWNYYFEPLALDTPQPKEEHILTLNQIGDSIKRVLLTMSNERGYALITKYIKIKPSIHRQVAQFSAKHFKNAIVIGVHYRGGIDKAAESRQVSYEEVYQALNKAIATVSKTQRFVIFVASDMQPFIEYLKSKFNNIVFTNAQRSKNSNPIHYCYDAGFSRAAHGQECLIDMLLLAESSILIKTASCLSLCANFANPRMNTITLNTHTMIPGCLR